jgi:hypothetical protein
MFPRAIPLQWVDCIRVTHPCAGRQLLRKVLLPLDLHVLGLPLAFILSQDQTLRCNITLSLSVTLFLKIDIVAFQAVAIFHLFHSLNELFDPQVIV